MKKKILITDDEPGIVRLLSKRLEYNNYTVLTAYNGLECLTIAEKEAPNLILMDIQMPYCDGIDTFNRLLSSEFTQDIPVIFMTAFPTELYKAKLIHMGAKDCISKPFRSVDLVDSIKNALN